MTHVHIISKIQSVSVADHKKKKKKKIPTIGNSKCFSVEELMLGQLLILNGLEV